MGQAAKETGQWPAETTETAIAAAMTSGVVTIRATPAMVASLRMGSEGP